MNQYQPPTLDVVLFMVPIAILFLLIVVSFVAMFKKKPPRYRKFCTKCAHRHMKTNEIALMVTEKECNGCNITK